MIIAPYIISFDKLGVKHYIRDMVPGPEAKWVIMEITMDPLEATVFRDHHHALRTALDIDNIKQRQFVVELQPKKSQVYK